MILALFDNAIIANDREPLNLLLASIEVFIGQGQKVEIQVFN